MVVLEAMYAGCPVFSTRTAGPEDIIKNGINGFLFSGLQMGEWVEKIRRSEKTFSRSAIRETEEAEL